MRFTDIKIGEDYAFNPQKQLIGTWVGYQSRVKVLEPATVKDRPWDPRTRLVKGFKVKLVKAGSHASGPQRRGTVFECRARDLVHPWAEEAARIADSIERERRKEEHELVRDIKITHQRCRLAARGLKSEDRLERDGDYQVSPITAGAEFRFSLDQMAALLSNGTRPAVDDSRIGHLPYKVTFQSGKVKVMGKRNRVVRYRIMCNKLPVTDWGTKERISRMAAVLQGRLALPADPYEEDR